MTLAFCFLKLFLVQLLRSASVTQASYEDYRIHTRCRSQIHLLIHKLWSELLNPTLNAAAWAHPYTAHLPGNTAQMKSLWAPLTVPALCSLYLSTSVLAQSRKRPFSHQPCGGGWAPLIHLPAPNQQSRLPSYKASKQLCWMPELYWAGRQRGYTNTMLCTLCWQFNC